MTATAAAPLLEMRHIRKAYPGVVALDDVSLTVEAGDVHMLLGENGAGKSTLIRILSGASRRDAGDILVNGQTVAINGPRDAIAAGIRVIYQELNLVPDLSVAENIFLGAAPTRRFGLIDRRALHRQAAERLAELGLAIEPGLPLRRLGIAQRQMVEIAKALATHDARILVMDEPTSSLTSREVDHLFAVIARLAARGVGVVYITHRLDEVFRIGRRITVLRDGRHVTTRNAGDLPSDELIGLMANRTVAEHYPRTQVPRGEELLRADGIGRGSALSGINFALHAGEVLGVAGLVGAGRSELARVLSGADPYDQGQLLVERQPVRFRRPADAIARGIGLLPEDRKAEGLVGSLTVARNIALPHGRRLARYGILRRGSEKGLADPLRDQLRIKATAVQPVRLLSGGTQQKVVLGKWLAGRARVFIFDEPTRGIDVGAKVEVYQLMNRLTLAGAGILMISSELPELLGMSDRILVMYRGRLQAEFDRREATEERVLAAALGRAS